MNKSELIMKVAEDADISKAKAEAAVNALINSVKEVLKAGGTVALTGLVLSTLRNAQREPDGIPRLERTSRSRRPTFPGSKLVRG